MLYRAYYVVKDNGMFIGSEPVEIDLDNKDLLVTYMHGRMFEADWCPQTPHAIH